jgi:outer membrane protein assembly factor BamB/tRNA A-37 threonylcarbamoyl transferase component Bud32
VLKANQANNSEDLSLPKGTRLADRYLIQDTISASSMSTVYQARDLHFPNVVKLVAVKEMVNPSPDPEDREIKVKNFERHVNLLATLSHPSIPRIFDYFSQGRHAYFVLEYVQGETLETILGNSPGFLSQDEVIQWTIGLCEVLLYLHSHQPEPVIFRDLNPSNIMLDQNNHLMLVDFGIAAVFSNEEEASFTGSPGYSPPELLQGELNAQVDVYSLGATMHHLLSGQDPRKESPYSFAERPIRGVNPDISPELEAIIATAVQYQPSDRYQSADELKSALLEMIGRSDSRQLSPQFNPVIPIADNTIQPLWVFTCADEIRGSAACDRGIVYFGSYDNYLYALNLESGKLLWKYQAEGGIVSRPAILDDSVFIGSEDSRLHVISRRSGTLLWTYYTQGPVRSSPFPAHGHIFVGSDDWAIHAININGGRGIWQIETSAEVRSTPFVAQDAVYAGNESGEFYCLDFRGSIKWRFKAKRAITSSPTIADNLVLFCSLDSHLYALDAKSGYLVWRFKMDRGSISSPHVADGLIFTGSIDGNIYCVNLYSAKEVWRFQTEHQITGSPIVIKDCLYCGSVDGNLYCLDHQTGQLRWKFKTNNPITATPAAQDGMIFIGSTDKQFYALPADPSG